MFLFFSYRQMDNNVQCNAIGQLHSRTSRCSHWHDAEPPNTNKHDSEQTHSATRHHAFNHSTTQTGGGMLRPVGGETGLTLQVRQLLLRHILTSNHVLNDAMHSVQYHLVVAQWQHRVYLSVQQAVSVSSTLHFTQPFPHISPAAPPVNGSRLFTSFN